MIIAGHALSVFYGYQLDNSTETRPVVLTRNGKTLGLPPLIPSLYRPKRSNPRFGLICTCTNSPQPLSTYTIGNLPLKGYDSALDIAEDVEREAEGCCDVQYSMGDVPEHTASLARSVFLLKPTSQLIKRVMPRKSINGQPVSFAAVMLSAAMYMMMAARTYISNRTRRCSCCGGYGIVRCDLCQGHRVIYWEGKYKHTQPCPKCFGKRYVKCHACFGIFGKSIFQHKSCGKLSVAELRKIEEEGDVDEQWVGAPKWVI